MVKEMLKLLVALGVVGGIAVAPNMRDEVLKEPTLDLPVVGTYEKLEELVKKSEDIGTVNLTNGMFLSKSAVVMESVPMADSVTSNSVAKNDDYSTTNVQVKGVDEADIVKNDGKYIYHLVKNELVISEINPASSMKILSKTKFDDNFNATDLYIEDNLVIVLGTYYKNHNKEPKIYYEGYYPSNENYTVALIHNAADKTKLSLEKKVEVNGYYVSSRKIGNYLYFVANKNLYRSMFKNPDDVMPLYRDTAVSEEIKKIDLNCVRYIPDYESSQYIMTVGVDLNNLKKEAEVSTCLGNSENIYSSAENMYIAFTSYEKEESVTDTVMKIVTPPTYFNNQSTTVYRFKLEDGKADCKAAGKVPGTVLNQFSMDENGDYFRIATTKGSIYDTGENKSKNNMYVLDKELKTVGSIEDIAPGEKIYSVRFMGDRAYMVTFRKVDPLFVIDLKDPQNPSILGKLKIPGYSDYLHPYDENHIIGFGKDADLVSSEGNWGWADENGTVAYYQGIKIALFDVTDPNNPIEMFKENIGDRGTESELLNNHKALLFSKDKNLLAFPVSVATRPEGSKANTYGDTTFVGAYVYNLDLTNGFDLKAKLTNLDEEDMKKMGYYYYGDKTIDRLIYIGDTLYTVSNCGYSGYSMKDYSKIGELKI